MIIAQESEVAPGPLGNFKNKLVASRHLIKAFQNVVTDKIILQFSDKP